MEIHFCTKATATSMALQLKHDLSAYIDDIYLQETTYLEFIKNIEETILLLRPLRFAINVKKRTFFLTTELRILGFLIN